MRPFLGRGRRWAERSLPGGDQLIKIGEEVSEHFDYRPASLIRVRVVRPKYRQPSGPAGGSPIAIAELPERPIGGRAS